LQGSAAGLTLHGIGNIITGRKQFSQYNYISGEMNLSIPGLIIVCGLQGGGKSYLIRYVMHENQKKFDWGMVFSNTGFSADNFEYIDKRFVYAKYDELALENLKSIHEQLVEKGKKPSGFVIFDDCLFGKQWCSEAFLSLMTQLRHYGITCILPIPSGNTTCILQQRLPSGNV
jgi:hypothetical protein